MSTFFQWIHRLLCRHIWYAIEPKYDNTDIATQYFGGLPITLKCVVCGCTRHKRIKP